MITVYEKIENYGLVKDAYATLRRWKTPYVVYLKRKEASFMNATLVWNRPEDTIPFERIMLHKRSLSKYVTPITSSLIQMYIVGLISEMKNIFFSEHDNTIYVVQSELPPKRPDYATTPLFYFLVTQTPNLRKNNYWLKHVDTDKVIQDLRSLNSKKYKTLIDDIISSLQSNKKSYSMITYTGYEALEVSNALKQYIDNNMPLEAEMCAFELYSPEQLKLLYKILMKVCVRDIGVADMPVVLSTIRYITNEHIKPDPATLATLVQLLCQSEKTRIAEEYYAVFSTTKGIEAAEGSIQVIDTGNNSRVMFTRRLQEHNPICFYWVRFVGETYVWEQLKILPPDVYDILLTASEVFPHLSTSLMSLGIVLILYNVCGEPCMPYDYEQDVNMWEQQPFLSDLVSGDYYLEISKLNKQDLVPQSPTYYSKELEEIYSKL